MSGLWGVPDNWATSIDGSDERQAAMQMAQIGHERALSAQEQMKTRMMGLQMQQQEKYLQSLSQRSGQAIDSADQMMAKMMEDAKWEEAMGHPDNAAKIISLVALRENQQRQAKLAETKAKEALSNIQSKKTQDMYEIFQAINGPEDFARAQMIIQGKYPDEPLPKELQTYDPKVVDFMKRVTKRGWEQTKEDNKGARQEEHEAFVEGEHRKQESFRADEARAAQAAAQSRQLERQGFENQQRLQRQAAEDQRARDRQAFQDQQRRSKEEWEAQQRKARGEEVRAIGSPDSTMLRAADAMIRKDFPNLAGDMALGKNDQINRGAYDIASQAKALMAANRGVLSADQAMARIYAEKKAKGEFRNVAPAEKHWYGKDTPGKDAYEPGAKPVAQATKTPAAKTEEDNKALAWAKANPKDPRAKKILELNHE